MTIVGRVTELVALEGSLDRAAAGRADVVYLVGEPGIGKTTLIAELLVRAERRGFAIAAGRASEFESDVPFAILTEAGEPLLGKREKEEPTAPAFRARLERLAARQPLVLALDDLHWADAASVDVVCQLLHRGVDGAVLVVLASRPAQTDQRVFDALAEATRRDRAQRLELVGMSVSEAAELIGPGVDAEQLAGLYRESGGNPLFLQQLARALARPVEAATARETSAADAELPAVVRAVVGREIDGLLGPARKVIDAAAVAGDPFEIELVAAVAELGVEETAQQLDALVALDLIRDIPGEARLRFRHPVVRRAVYQATGAAWRTGAHRRAARALADRGLPAAIRAHHVERAAVAGDQEAVAVLVEAAQESLVEAPASAARWLDSAVRLIPETAETLERRLELLVRRAAALGATGDIEENRATVEAFLQIAPPEPTPLRLRAVMLAARLDDLLGRQEQARSLVTGELERLPDQRSAQAAELMRVLAFTNYLDADWPAMKDWAERALGARATPMVEVGARSALALAHLGMTDAAAAEQEVSVAASLFDGLSAQDVANDQPGIVVWLGWAEVCLERFGPAVEHLRRATAITQASRQRPLTVGLLAIEGQALLLSGQIDELAGVVDGAFEAALLATSNLFMCWVMTQKCAFELQRGDLFAAVRFGEQGVSMRRATGSPLTQVAPVQLAEALLEIGEPERASQQLVRDDGSVDLPAFAPHQPRGYELLSRIELALGRLGRATELADRASQVAAQLGQALPRAHALRAGARVSLANGHPEEAVRRAEMAVDAAAEAGAAVEAAVARTLLGCALAAAGRRTEAVAQLRDAHRELVGCGARYFADRAARELRRLGHVVARPASAADGSDTLAGLTARELEVLDLLASGMTNRSIAERLLLSVRTVDRHVSRVYEKLGVHSRAAAATRYARVRAG